MNIALWILQVLVGGFFIWHMTLLPRPNPERLQQGMNWVLEMRAGLRIFAAIAEGLAGIALIFAGLVRPVSWLAALAGAERRQHEMSRWLRASFLLPPQIGGGGYRLFGP